MSNWTIDQLAFCLYKDGNLESLDYKKLFLPVEKQFGGIWSPWTYNYGGPKPTGAKICYNCQSKDLFAQFTGQIGVFFMCRSCSDRKDQYDLHMSRVEQQYHAQELAKKQAEETF